MVVISKKHYNRTKIRAIRRAKFFLRHPFVLPVSVFFVMLFLGMGLFISLGSSTRGATDKRIVSVFVDGKQQTYSTRATNVGDLLERLKITLNEEDLVEPAVQTPIIQDNTQVNIYRARPIQIIDGSRTIVVLTAQRAPRLVAAEAGLDLYPEDNLDTSRDDTLLESGISDRYVVKRSVPVQLITYGVLSVFRTTAGTVGELLSQRGVVLSEGENVQPTSLDTPIQADMLVSVNFPNRKTVAVNEELPYSSSTKNDPGVKAGSILIATPGAKGLRAVIYEIQEENGVEVGRSVLQTVTVREPVNEVRIRGTQALSSFSVSDDKQAIMAAAGISPNDYGSVDYIIQHESNWRPGAINAGGCIGLGQRCPSRGSNALASACPNWETDAVCQLKHFSGYAARYGGWQGAYQAWTVQGWW